MKVIDTSITNLNRLLNPLNYQKGAWVLHMIREQVGDTMFFAGIRKYYETYKMSNAYTEDFLKLMTEMSGVDLVTGMKPWLNYAGHIKMDMGWSKKGNKLIIEHDIRGPQVYGIGPHRLTYKVGEEERYLDIETDTNTNYSEFPYPESDPTDFKWVDPYHFLMEVKLQKGSLTKEQ